MRHPLRRRLRTVLLRLVTVAAALSLLAAGAVWFLIGTEPGARWVFGRLGALMEGSLEVADLAGPLHGPLTARGLVYEAEGFEVQVEHMALDWRVGALLDRRLDIVSLEAEGVRVTLADREERSEPAGLPDVHLPVNIIVHEARVRGVEVGRPASGGSTAEPLTIHSIDLVTRVTGDVVEIERLTVRAPELAADVAGRVEPQGDYPVELRVEWSARHPGQPRWAGEGTLSGTLEDLRVLHRLTDPLIARLDARLSQPLRDLSFDATVEARPFAPAVLGAELPGLTVGGRVHAAGTLGSFRAEADLAADHADHGPARVDVALIRDGDRWHIGRLVLTSPAAPARVEATGEVKLAAGEEPRFALDASWRDLAWPLSSEPSVRSPQGRASMAGHASAYELDVAARLLAPGLPPTPIELSGRGGRERFAVERARAELFGGVMTARGEIAWRPRTEWRLEVAGENLDPAAVWPDATGNLSLAARTAGHLEEAGPFGRIGPLSVTGTLRAEPVAASGALELAGERVAIAGLDLTWGSIHLATAGQVAPSFDLDLDLQAPNVALALPAAGGSLAAHGRLSGPPTALRVEGSVEGRDLVWGELSAAELAAQADVDLALRGALALDVTATRLASGETKLDRVTIIGRGSREVHRLDAEVDAEKGRLRLAARGGLGTDDTWRGELAALDLTLPEAGSWSLAAPATVAIGAESADLGRLCEVSGDARLCAEAAWRGAAGWDARLELTALPLALAAPFLLPDVEISGALGGRVEALADATGALTAEARLELGPGQVIYPLTAGGTETLRFDRGSLVATVDGGGVEAAIALPLPGLGRAEAELALPGYRLAGVPAEEQPLAAAMTAQITDLSFLQGFSEQLDETAGRLTADLRLDGTVGRPRIHGEARLEEGRAAVPQLGIQLTDLRLSATSDGGDVLRLEGSVRSGRGMLTLTGEAPPAPDAERPIRVTVAGERFTAMATREVELLASPDLGLTYDGALLEVGGEVLVPEATIEIEKPRPSVVVASDDVVFVGGSRRSTAAGMPIAMKVRVVLGEKVEIAILGLQATPTGSLLLIEEPGEPTTGTGEIDLAGGTFKAYGQDLTIERGRLVFNGPIDDPRVDLRAYRSARDSVVAGLEARGSLSQPEITLWSEPPMDQSNQLSYILLGRPLGEASPSEGSLVSNAAESLGIKGGNLLAKRLAAQFGLEEARIETTGGLDEASLVLGKYLSPRLYMSYGVGLFEAVDTLRIRYLMSSKWALEATTGIDTGADLLYTIERGAGAKRQAPGDGKALEVRETPDDGD